MPDPPVSPLYKVSHPLPQRPARPTRSQSSSMRRPLRPSGTSRGSPGDTLRRALQIRSCNPRIAAPCSRRFLRSGWLCLLLALETFSWPREHPLKHRPGNLHPVGTFLLFEPSRSLRRNASNSSRRVSFPCLSMECEGKQSLRHELDSSSFGRPRHGNHGLCSLFFYFFSYVSTSICPLSTISPFSILMDHRVSMISSSLMSAWSSNLHSQKHVDYGLMNLGESPFELSL